MTNQIDVVSKKNEILGKVRSFNFVSKHNFFPLLHTVILERRYKKAKNGDNSSRAHSHSGESTVKKRPLHYATHIDSMIFGYYAEMLQKKWLDALEEVEGLSDCVTAYRRIPDPLKSGKYKSTIHFANEVFKEVGLRAVESCTVLKFDIESFFSSIDHKELKEAWRSLLAVPTLPADHFNVYRAATRFSYINRDDLRVSQVTGRGRAGFDEKKLAEIRKRNVVAFFSSPAEMRTEIKNGQLRVHKNSFKNSSGETVGIPQGLPISAVLANLYLIKADAAILEQVVIGMGGYYRRYSDDIVVICRPDQKEAVKRIIEKSLTESKVVVSIPKTEEFYFRQELIDTDDPTTVCYRVGDNVMKKGHPLTYLGFEYYGDKILIKSANVAKFYRRMVMAIKSRTKRASVAAGKIPNGSVNLFKRRLYRLYTNINLEKSYKKRNFKWLEQNRFGEFVYKTKEKPQEFRSNYFSYARRAARTMEDGHIVRQLRKHRRLFNCAVVLQRRRMEMKKGKYTGL